LALLISAYDKLIALHPNRYGLRLIGNSTIDHSSNQKFIEQTSIGSKEELERALAEIDILIVPSTHDNLPNVLGEALMNGVGVIGSDVGGIPEILNIFNLNTFESGNEQGLISAILNFKLPNPVKLQTLASSVFGFDSISSLISNVYKQELIRIERTNNPT
jgi:glycosyltransferase involved in cell wall biosynthesis